MKCKIGIPEKIKCNLSVNPLGIPCEDITFSFHVKSIEKNQLLGGYRIVCASSIEKLNLETYDKWDSGIVLGNVCFGLPYKGTVNPCERVYYKIGCVDSEGAFSGFSKFNYFETALSELQAQWVYDEKFDGNYAPHFAQQFTVSKKIKQARLYITGLGYFDAKLNGKDLDEWFYKPTVTVYDDRPLNGILDYFFNQPKKTIYYLTYDVTKLIQAENILSVLVGNGWYYHAEKQCEGNFSYNTPRLIFELHIHYTDGEKQIFKSGKETFVKKSHIVKNTLFKGETCDMRRYLKQDELSISDRHYASVAVVPPSGTLLPLNSPCDKIRTVLTPKSVKTVSGKMIADFGVNHSGVLRLTAKGEEGSVITVVYGEEINEDGSLNHHSTSWGVQIQTDELILSKEQCVWHPLFTFHGYRYAEISVQGNVELLEILSLEINTGIEITSCLETTDKLINDIHQLYLRTQLSNLHGGFPSDCPHREKRGFTGDGQVTCEAALTSLNIHSTYKKWIKDIIDVQDVSGYVPHTAPFSGGGGGPLYGSAIGIVPWAVYCFTLDKEVLRNAHDGLYRWIQYLNTRHNGDYIIDREESGWCLGDWFCPTQIDISPKFANTYAFLLCCKLYKKMAKVLQNENSAEMESRVSFLQDLSEKITASFNKTFFDEKKAEYDGNKNGANIFALTVEAVRVSERERVIDKTLEFYRKNPVVNTGIMGTKLLFEFLTENGGAEIAYQILCRREYPSYGYMIDSGATTLWECWERDTTPDFKINETEHLQGYPVSHNHPMFGSVNFWLFKAVAGIHIDNLPLGSIVLKPLYADKIPCVKARQQIPYGDICVEYEVKNGFYTAFKAEIPTGVTATVILEKRLMNKNHYSPTHQDDLYAHFSVGSGEHNIIG